MAWPGMLWTLVFRMRPTLSYMGRRGHAWLTVLRLSDNQFSSGRTVGRASIISTVQGTSNPPPSALHTRLVNLCPQVAQTPIHTLDTLPVDPRKVMHWASSSRGLASALACR